MRTSWMLSRPILSPTRDRGGQPGIPGRRTITAWLLAGLVLSLVLGLTGCGTGGSDSATRPSTEHSGTRPEPSGTEPDPDHGRASQLSHDHPREVG
jgi:hypothetical protein